MAPAQKEQEGKWKDVDGYRCEQAPKSSRSGRGPALVAVDAAWIQGFGVLLGKCYPFSTRVTAIHASHSGLSCLEPSPGADRVAAHGMVSLWWARKMIAPAHVSRKIFSSWCEEPSGPVYYTPSDFSQAESLPQRDRVV